MDEGVVFAPLGVEAFALRGGNHSLRVFRCGVGPERALRAASRVASTASVVAVGGLCGALANDLAPGDLVVPDELRAPELAARAVDGAGLREALARRGFRVHGGVLFGADHGVTGHERSSLRASGGIAVDMESPWLAEAAGVRPFVVLRVVLDGPEHELMRPGTALRGWRALVRLREASAALEDWAATSLET